MNVKIGDLAMCQNGIVGTVENIITSPRGTTLYIGKTAAGKRWQSVSPTKVE